MGYVVYIVSARGPYAEKAAGERFWIDPVEAEERAQELTESNCYSGIFRVYEMVLTDAQETKEV